jgi:hypothetical protein
MRLPLFDFGSINNGYFNTQRAGLVQGLTANMLNGRGSLEVGNAGRPCVSQLTSRDALTAKVYFTALMES